MNQLETAQNDIINALSALEPGKLPLSIFNQVARLTVTPVVEIVPFYRLPNGALRVYLIRRGLDDPLWANMYHVPGTIVSGADEPGSLLSAFQRVTVSRLVDYVPSEFDFVDIQLCKVSRGMEVAIIYTTELAIIPPSSSLFDPLDLPKDMIEGQAAFVKAAFQKMANA
jgi:hypothetical protein